MYLSITLSVYKAFLIIVKSSLDSIEHVLEQTAPTGFVWLTHYTPDVDHQLNAKMSATDGILHWGEFVDKQRNTKQK